MSTSTDYYLVYLKYWFKTQEKYLDFATWLNLHRSISFWKPCVPGLLGVCIVLIRTYWSPHCVSQWTVSQQSRYNYWFQILNQQAIKFQWVSPPIFTGVCWGDSQGWRARDRSCEISLYLPLLLQRFPSSSFSNPPNTRHQEPSISSLVNAHCRNVWHGKPETSRSSNSSRQRNWTDWSHLYVYFVRKWVFIVNNYAKHPTKKFLCFRRWMPVWANKNWES